MPNKKKKDPVPSEDKHPEWAKLKRPPKDINAPKRPPSAYFLYSHERREALRQIEEHKTKSVTALSKIIAGEWKKLEVEQKKRYETDAKAKKKEYDGKIAEYQKTALCKQYEIRKKAFEQRNKQIQREAKRRERREKREQKQKEKKNGEATDDDDEEEEEDDEDEEQQSITTGSEQSETESEDESDNETAERVSSIENDQVQEEHDEVDVD
eukprot:1056399_1